MSYGILPDYPRLGGLAMAEAPQLHFTTYGLAGYESVVQYFAEFPIAAADAVFSFEGVAGAVYTLQSTSYRDPATLLVYDQQGSAFIDDDSTGLPGSDHITFIAPYSGSYFIDPGWLQGSGAGQQGVTLSVYEDSSTVGASVLAGSAQGERLVGGSSAESLYGYGGADTLLGAGADDYLDGGPGLDLARFGAERAAYDLRPFGDRFLVIDLEGGEGRDLLSNVERLAFRDLNVALDIDGAAGQAFRVYQAAFNRAPDAGGLGFWIYQRDQGVGLEALAAGFIDSAEFRSIYGTAPSNYEVVYRFYQNVLHREPDAGGLDFWVQVLDAQRASLAAVLLGFSESPENYGQLIEAMAGGIAYQPWL